MKAEQQQSPEYPTGTDTGREVTNRVGGRDGSTRKMTQGENGHGNRPGGSVWGLKRGSSVAAGLVKMTMAWQSTLISPKTCRPPERGRSDGVDFSWKCFT